MSLIKNRYTNKIKQFYQSFLYKDKLPFLEEELKPIIYKNRKFLGSVPTWWDETLFDTSVFQYGVLSEVKPLLNKQVGDSIMYTDLLCYTYLQFTKIVKDPVKYLELGVSVGKNFLTLSHFFNNAELTGFEIEKINPVIESFFIKRDESSWSTPIESVKKTSSTKTSYSFNSNQITYMSADIWDTEAWKKLNQAPFHIIFSDAFHSKQAIIHEMNKLLEHGCIGEKFAIFWDDLYYDMRDGFFEIRKILIKSKKFTGINCYLIEINGWLGDNEGKHTVGILTNVF